MADNPYDLTPYPSLAYVHTHPDRLAMLGGLLGLQPAPVERCRVLEIGCAGGGNLLPMAYALPGSSFVGIDYAARQIDEGRRMAAALGLHNVALHALDILAAGPDLGEFDYIIAHGVYSWVPAPVRERLLALCRACLAPQGIAYISYNVLPGWHTLGILRDAMLYHTRAIDDPRQKAQEARAIVRFLAGAIPEERGAYAALFAKYVQTLDSDLKGQHDAFLLHDEMEETNDAVYFHQFVEHAGRHGLQYLAEAELRNVLPIDLAPEVVQQLQGMAQNSVDFEQYLDFIQNRMFRQTLLCHADRTVDRTLRPERLFKLRIASRARPAADDVDIAGTEPVQFRIASGGALTTDHPVTKAAMLHLRRAWPLAVPFGELFQRAYASVVAARGGRAEPAAGDADPAGAERRDAFYLAANLLRAHSYSSQLVSLHTHMPRLSPTVSERPTASALARLLAADSPLVTNLWHDRVQLTDGQQRLLQRLDGGHSRVDLLDDLVQAEPGAPSATRRAELAGQLEQDLGFFARSALLVG